MTKARLHMQAEDPIEAALRNPENLDLIAKSFADTSSIKEILHKCADQAKLKRGPKTGYDEFHPIVLAIKLGREKIVAVLVRILNRIDSLEDKTQMERQKIKDEVRREFYAWMNKKRVN